MTGQKLPLRMKLLLLLAEAGAEQSTHELLTALSKDYGAEKQCSRTVIMDHLFNMASLGLVKPDREWLDEGGRVEISFSITAFGRSRNRYYPGKFWE